MGSRARGAARSKPIDVSRPIRIPLVLGGVALSLFIATGCERAGPSEEARLEVRRILGEPGRLPGQFMYPRGIAAGQGQLWVVDKGARLQRLDTESGRADVLFTTPKFDQGKPTGLTVAPLPAHLGGGTGLYVADTHEHRVLIYDAQSDSGEPIATFGSYGTGDGQFTYPTDIAVLVGEDGSAHRFYVSEYGGHDRVSIFDEDFTFLSSFGSFGVASEAPPGEVVFDRPQSIAIDHEAGELIVADACNHRVGRFTLEGEPIAWVTGEEAGGQRLNYPYGIEILEGQEALIAEYGGNRIRHMHLETGVTLGIYGEGGRETGQLASPWGVAVVGAEAFVLDSGNNRIQVMRSPAPALMSEGGAR